MKDCEEEEKRQVLHERLNATTEIEDFNNDYYSDDDYFGTKNDLIARMENCTPHGIIEELAPVRLFFSSAVKATGRIKDIYFMESCTIGIGNSESSFTELDFSFDPAGHVPSLSMCHPQEQQLPIGDHSLFGNESDGSISEFDSYEVDDAQKTPSPRESSSVICKLCAGEELFCEVTGKAAVFCVRFAADHSKSQVILLVLGNGKEESVRVKASIKEGDLLVAISNDYGCALSKEGILDLMQRIAGEKAPRSLTSKRAAKEITKYMYGKSGDKKELTVIAAWISRSI